MALPYWKMKRMTKNNNRVTRLVRIGEMLKTVSATLKDFEKMEQSGAEMVAEWNGAVWHYFDSKKTKQPSNKEQK